jgi:glycosyltransferase involved in cell wall biosynthesis
MSAAVDRTMGLAGGAASGAAFLESGALQKSHTLSILQVVPELNAGGVERTALEMAEAISRAGGLALVASAGGRLEPDLEAAGGELIRLPVHTKNPLTALANAFALARLIRDRGVEIVHARSRAPAWSALLAARMAGAHFVTTYHGIYNARSALKRFYNSVMARGDMVIANSDFTRAHVIAQHRVDPERVVAIPRGVDLDVFNPERVRPEEAQAMRASWGLAAQDARCVIIAPARLTRWKGQLILIEAAALLARAMPGAFKIIIAGDAQGRDAYVAEMKAGIAENALHETVAIAGHIGHMPSAFAASDIAVFPVIEPEAFGRGAVEAQAMRVPVIASKLGGYTETVIDGETGLLAAPGDARALAAAMARLVAAGADNRRAMGARGQIRVRNSYTKAALQRATLAIYQRLVRESGESAARENKAGAAMSGGDRP